MEKRHPLLGETLDGIYTLKEVIGEGGYARVYFAEVDLEKFDYAMVVAYREKRQKKHAVETHSRHEHFEKIHTRLEELRKPEWREKVRKAVESVPDLYPFSGTCAVKVLDLPPDLKEADRETRIKRFEGEWMNLMGITHPHVIRVYGGGRTTVEGRETWYYAMEYLEDILEEIIGLPVKDKVEIVRKAARGLRLLHSHKLVHRDIKPANILVTRTGDVKITDAGIAKDLLSETEMTVTQAVIGTPHYESPEQVKSSKHVDYRTDIYSLGATFYTWLTGIKPYEDREELASVMDVLYALRKLYEYVSRVGRDIYSITRLPADIVLPTPVERLADVEERVADVVKKMMNPDKEKFRYQSMDEVITDLEALLKGNPTSIEVEKRERFSRVEEKIEQRLMEKEKKKKQTVMISLAGLGALILLGGAALLMSVFSSSEKPSPAFPAPAAVPSGETAPPEDDPLARLEARYTEILRYARGHAGELDAVEKAWSAFLEEAKDTPYGEKARAELRKVAEERKRREAEREAAARKEEELKKLMTEAERYAADHPEDLEGMLQRYEAVAKAGEGTSYAAAAAAGMEKARTSWKKHVEETYKKVAAEVERLTARGRFKEALEILRQAEEEPVLASMRERLKKSAAEVEKKRGEAVDRRLAEVMEKACALLAKKEYAEARRLLAEAASEPLLEEERARGILKAAHSVARLAAAFEKRVGESFAEDRGKNITVKTRKGGTKRGKLVRVEGGKLYLEISYSPGVVAGIQVPVADIAFEEKVKRIGAPRRPEEWLALSMLALAEEDLARAEASLAEAGNHPLRPYVVGYLKTARMGAREKAAYEHLAGILRTAGFRRSPPDNGLCAAVEKLDMPEEAARAVEQALAALRKEYGDTSVCTTYKELIEALELRVASLLGRPTIRDVLHGRIVSYAVPARRVDVMYDFSRIDHMSDWLLRGGAVREAESVKVEKGRLSYRPLFRRVEALSCVLKPLAPRVGCTVILGSSSPERKRRVWYDPRKGDVVFFAGTREVMRRRFALEAGKAYPVEIRVGGGKTFFGFGPVHFTDTGAAAPEGVYEQVIVAGTGPFVCDDVRIAGILQEEWLRDETDRIAAEKRVELIVKQGGKGKVVFSSGDDVTVSPRGRFPGGPVVRMYDMYRSTGWGGCLFFIRFDLSRMPRDAYVLKATLRLWCTKVGGKAYKKPARNIGVAEVLTRVDLDKCTWRSPDGGKSSWKTPGRGPHPGFDLSKPLAVAPDKQVGEKDVPCWMEWSSGELAAVINRWLREGKRGIFCVHGLSTNLLAQFASFEYGDAAKRPQLVIEYTGLKGRKMQFMRAPREKRIFIRKGTAVDTIRKAVRLAAHVSTPCILVIGDSGVYDEKGTLRLGARSPANECRAPANLLGLESERGCWPTVRNLRMRVEADKFRLARLAVGPSVFLFGKKTRSVTARNCAFFGGGKMFSGYRAGNRSIVFRFEHCVFHKVGGEMVFGPTGGIFMRNCILSRCGAVSTENDLSVEYLCVFGQRKVFRNLTFAKWYERLKNRKDVWVLDPLLSNPDAGDFRLRPNTPLRGKGPGGRDVGIQWDEVTGK